MLLQLREQPSAPMNFAHTLRSAHRAALALDEELKVAAAVAELLDPSEKHVRRVGSG
jgi:hypothetical protein